MAGFDQVHEEFRAFFAKLERWHGEFARAFERRRRERFGRFKQPDPAQVEALAAEARRDAGEEFARESFAALDRLCDAYMAEPLPQNRAKLRADVGGHPVVAGAVWSYAEQNAEMVRSAGDEARLVHALAAVSLDDLRTDALKVDELLARLWLQAQRAGLDPRRAFEAAAAVSNRGMGGGGAFMARHLRGFEHSLAYKELLADPRARPRSA